METANAATAAPKDDDVRDCVARSTGRSDWSLHFDTTWGPPLVTRATMDGTPTRRMKVTSPGSALCQPGCGPGEE